MTMRKPGKIIRLCALALALMLLPLSGMTEDTDSVDYSRWTTFLLLCNEGMTNDGGNVGNTIMVVSMHPGTGKIRQMMVTWDTFIQYEGFDFPQLIGSSYRNKGPEGTVDNFNKNFQMDVTHYMSLNFLNLASLIDAYGGVTVDVTRQERNALNGMVASKKETIQAQADAGLLTQLAAELLAQQYQLDDFGPETKLNGLQAAGYGWLQYDSVYNCCERDNEVIGSLFNSVAERIKETTAFYNSHTEYPADVRGRRVINLDAMTEEDVSYLRQQIDPIFQMSYNNLTEEEIRGISVTLAKSAFEAARQGVDIFTVVETAIFPLESRPDIVYDMIAGNTGILVDYEANSKAMKEYLFAEE